MTLWQAVIMGIIQGLGEFLPISSSGHLLLVPWFFEWQDPGLTFDIALHAGTLLAVVIYFHKDWLSLLRAAFSNKDHKRRRIFWLLVLATIPAAVSGFLFKDIIESKARSPVLIGLMLIVFGLFLYFADKHKQTRKLTTMTVREALFIGIAQALALIPGVSRSGVTITAARLFSYTRDDAARFSFLLSTPVIFGATLLSITDLKPGEINMPFIGGIVVSCLVGMLSISVLLKIIKRHSLNIFVGYRILLGAFIIFGYLFLV